MGCEQITIENLPPSSAPPSFAEEEESIDQDEPVGAPRFTMDARAFAFASFRPLATSDESMSDDDMESAENTEMRPGTPVEDPPALVSRPGPMMAPYEPDQPRFHFHDNVGGLRKRKFGE